MDSIHRDDINDLEYAEISPMIKSWFEEKGFKIVRELVDDFCYEKKNQRVAVAIYAPNEERNFHHQIYSTINGIMIMASKFKWEISKSQWIRNDEYFESEISHPKFFKKLKKFIEDA